MKKKMPKLDMGGLYTGASKSRDVENQPVSGYGTSDANRCPPNCGPGSGARHAAGVRKRQQKGTDRGRRNIGRCRRGHNGQIICD